MQMWVNYIPMLRHAIWSKLRQGATVEEIEFNEDVSNWNRYVFLDIPFESFRIFGFMDDTGFRTTISVTGDIGFFDDIQKYSVDLLDRFFAEFFA